MINQFVLVGKIEFVYEETFVLNIKGQYIKLNQNELTKRFFDQYETSLNSVIGVKGVILEGGSLEPEKITYIKSEQEREEDEQLPN